MPHHADALCPLHQIPLEVSYRGVKTFADFPNLKVEGLPMRFCPKCVAEKKESAREIDEQKSNAFILKLKSLVEKSTFSEHLGKPGITVSFNPAKALLAGDGPGGKNQGDTVKFDDDIKARMEGFAPQKPLYSLDRLMLNQETMLSIRESLSLLEQQKLIYETWNLQSIDRSGRKVALNFYGEPGTGKTLAADAIANALNKDILAVSYAELESKYVGETPKNIRAAFQKAAETRALLFFDEADSILGKRLTNVTQATDHSVNLARSVMLIELDRFSGIVVFASNLVRNYDEAFLRRMIAHIEFSLPETAQRVDIWKSYLPPQFPIEPSLEFETLARESAGASGGDIKTAVLLAASYAAMRPKNLQIATQQDFIKAIRFVKSGKRRILSEQ
jgi:SpoVK/Ycf46/Vps4 family AAA+-type ATPase